MSAITAGGLALLLHAASRNGFDYEGLAESGLTSSDQPTQAGKALSTLLLDLANAAAKCDDPAAIQRGLLMFRQECGEEFEFRDNGGNWTGKKRCLFNHDLSRYHPAPAEPEAKVKGSVPTDAPAKCKHCGRYYGEHQAARSLCPNGDYEVNGWLETAFEPATLDDAQAASGTGVEDFVQDPYAHLKEAQKDPFRKVERMDVKGQWYNYNFSLPLNTDDPLNNYRIVPSALGEVKAAHERGEAIQKKYLHTKRATWTDEPEPGWDTDHEWRVKPAVKPWTAADMKPGIWLKKKKEGSVHAVTGWDESYIYTARMTYGYDYVMENFDDITTGEPKPCGKESPTEATL